MSKNERETEKIVRKKLEKAGIMEENGFLIEEQKSESPLITKLLKNSSKSGTGMGKPEFIITKSDEKDFVIVIECKPDTSHHESKDRNKFKDFAVDGALLYASYLSKEFNVIAIGVSGQAENSVKINTFLYPKGATNFTMLRDENKHPINNIISWERYIVRATFDPALAKSRHSDLMKFSRELHNYMRDYAKVTEAQKPLLVSGALLALTDKGFERAYTAYDGENLAQKTFQAIRDNIGKAQLGDNQESKKRAVVNAFSFIEHHPELHKVDKKKNESPLAHIIRDLHIHVKPFTKDHYDFDIIGNFYGEFIRYTGGDGKGLGIVLTPKHITDLFADLAKLNKNSVVLDTCCGTGGFLISAMKKMTENISAEEKKFILDNSLIGIEQEPQMFALAVSNMILRGDGKTNLYQGSCFDEALFDKVKDKASAGFINPPYSQKGEDLHEWNFVIQMLNALQKNATGIVIVPMSLAISPHFLREQLLKEHRLEAVMSMPDDLFYPVGAVSCIMVFTAHVPHDSDPYYESWFGYWKNDGFVKDKIKGRIPSNEEGWKKIKEKWITDFTNRKVIPGFSMREKVSIDEDWSAEAYIEEDYRLLSENDFKKTVLDYLSYCVSLERLLIIKDFISDQKDSFDVKNWKNFEVNKLFKLKLGVPIHKNTIKNCSERFYPGSISYVTRTTKNNGVEFYVNPGEFESTKIQKGNSITIGAEGFEAFYQRQDFITGNKVNILINDKISEFSGLFINTVLNFEINKKFSYGRGLVKSRLGRLSIKLPVDKNGDPDWQFMEDYIKSLPYSAEI